MRVLTDESGDDFDDLFLLAAGELRDLFKNLVHFAGWSSFAGAFELHFFTYQVGRTESVTGTYGGTNQTYAGDIEYRAWGAVKRHGSETIAYNELRISVARSGEASCAIRDEPPHNSVLN